MSGSRDLTSREAVQAVELAFIRELRWYPREPPAPDYGIDLYVEAAVDGVPNGRMLGVQIKGGASFFSETTDDGVVFRSEERHLDYWLGHSLPVIVALYDPGDQTILWQAVTTETAQSTGKGWKLIVPRAQRLDASSAPVLQDLGRGGGVGEQELRAWLDYVGRPSPGGGEQLKRARGVYLGLLPTTR
jgi:hypothetical protein